MNLSQLLGPNVDPAFVAAAERAQGFDINRRKHDLTGRLFGSWSVLSYAGIINEKAAWWCRCICGMEKEIRANTLLRGQSTSCGCTGRIRTIAANVTHGGTGTSEHRIWKAMWSRCTNPAAPRYAFYCSKRPPEQWRDFSVFLSDMGPRPSPTHSIDRIDNDKPYGPDNCRWATKREQCLNTRRNRMLTINGETLPLTLWADRLGIKPSILFHRVYRNWPADRLGQTPREPR